MRINIKPLNDTRGAVIEISKKALVKELKNEITERLEIQGNQQRLFYFGKELQDNVALFDYKVIEGGTIQLIVTTNVDGIKHIVDINNEEQEQQPIQQKIVDVNNKFYEIGDCVDVLLEETGSWYEGTINKICMEEPDQEIETTDEDIIFRITSAQHILPTFEVDVKFKDIRPRSYYVYKHEELTLGQIVLANYNLEETESRGLWYDFKITELTRTKIAGTIFVGSDDTTIENCSIVFKKELLRIETPELLENTEKEKRKTKFIPRKYPYNCSTCRDDQNKKCKKCGCKICLGKENWQKLLLCDECDGEYHIYCLDPPLDKVPTDDWYCPDCKVDDTEIVNKGEVKLTKKQMNMPNKKSTSTRDWGKGMATAGRSKVCTIVPKNHFGPIPNVDVGTRWKFRIQVSEVGVHRPPVGGIHGVAHHGAYSVVISSGYEDDTDGGDEFIYTGSGGRDLSGNKRVNVQSCDQVLTCCNKALALNCNAPFNEKGAEAKNWKAGKPVRVVRSEKAKTHSKFAPVEGYRYDGIYKIVKYYPERGKSGFIVWKYLLRRDDPEPAPWKKDGREFDMIYPPLYLESQAQKKENKNKSSSEPGPSGNSKRKRQTTNDLTDVLTKKPTLVYELPADVKKFIEKDKINNKHWIECSDALKNGKAKYLEKVQETFKCICCQDLLYEPVTLECQHSFCKKCLKRAFDCKMFTCPCCRNGLDEKLVIEINHNFNQALKLLFPGYGPGS